MDKPINDRDIQVLIKIMIPLMKMQSKYRLSRTGYQIQDKEGSPENLVVTNYPHITTPLTKAKQDTIQKSAGNHLFYQRLINEWNWFFFFFCLIENSTVISVNDSTSS